MTPIKLRPRWYSPCLLQPYNAIRRKDYIEILIKASAHDAIRKRLDLYGVFDKQLFPDLDGMAKWLKFHEFECQNGNI